MKASLPSPYISSPISLNPDRLTACIEGIGWDILLSALLLIGITSVAIFAPLLAPYDPHDFVVNRSNVPLQRISWAQMTLGRTSSVN